MLWLLDLCEGMRSSRLKARLGIDVVLELKISGDPGE